ncbi:hypothetical protein Tco_0660105 [Tanacetum coccineum]
MNFNLDREERVKELEEYMRVIINDFMQLFSGVTRRLKDKIRKEWSRMIKMEKITKYPDEEILEPLARHKFLEDPAKKDNEQKTKEHKRAILLSSRGAPSIRETSLIGSSFPAKTSIKHSSTPSVPTPSPGLNGEIFSVLMSPSIESWGEQKELSLWELGSRVGLYSERQSRKNATLSGLRNGNTVKESRLLMEFWLTIRDRGFNVGNTKVASIRDPRVKLAHRCIATTIVGRKETTHRVIEIDLYYLYCIYTPEVACNISYWLSKYMKGVRDKNLIFGGMLVTKIVRLFGLLTSELRDVLSIEPPPHMFKKKSLISMGVIMKLQNGMCVWPTPQAVEEEEEDKVEGDKGHDGAGGSSDMYRNISQGVWQVRQARWMD